ncbi:T9SS type A sorting domain-containing protein [Chryseolinea soli]|uniref:T9SS type A sorting domain-containing protein n=1 Tax=Chryseolinea soli TaxID=2321403 RepID=UPI00135AEE03|nr:T9SS type A sorting domain-containing protein [Chryseolinea soli]
MTIPLGQAAGAGYQVRVTSTNPTLTSSSSAAFTITALGISAPTVTGSPFCAGTTFNIANNLANACNFGVGNTFTVQLSNSAGSFAAPTTIGSTASVTAGNISVTLPIGATAGAGYLIRVVSSNPVVTGTNSAAFTIRDLGLNAPTVTGSPFCLGGTYSITNNLSNSCTFGAGNIFNVELSDGSGGFAAPTVIGTSSSTSGGAIGVTIPTGTTPAAGYRMRVTSTNPVLTSANNGANLTVSAYGLNVPTFAGTAFCPNQAVTVNYTVLNSCGLPNTPSANVFTAQLSNSFGSFASPTAIGTATSNTSGSISATIPVGAIPGNGYRIRVVSSNPGPGLISADNGTNLTVNAINLTAPTFAATTFCSGATFTLSYTFVSGCDFIAGNTFTAQLSDASGSFASPTTIGTSSATAPGSFSVTIPTTTASGSSYRIRVVASNPAVTSPDNGTNLTINAFGINAPTFAATSFCQGQPFTISYTIQNACAFPNTPSNNVFTAQLSDPLGSFAAPTTLGTVTATGPGTIAATIPGGTVAGTAYRIRVVSSNPGTGVIGANNGVDLTINASAGNPNVFGTTAWNAYAYSGTAFPITNNTYLGTYTETNLSFDSRNRWVNTAGPGAADASSGSGYAGCPVGATSYSVSFKRTNFTCGYYQIDIPAHDDDVRLFINGSLVFSHIAGCCDSHTNAWTGFLNASSTIEFQFLNGSGPGYLQVAFSATANPLTISPNIVQCSAPVTPATLSVSAPIALTYAWTPTTGLTPASGLGANVQAAPTTTTTYTATGTDAATGCSVAKTVTVTVSNATPTLTLTSVPATICSGLVTSTLSVSGASTYTWSPSAGLSATTGNVVTANPPSTTTYTAVGNNGCAAPAGSASAITTVTVQNVPGSPSPTTFGNGTWNVFSHNNTTLNDYYGYYTENNLSFNTATRWAGASGPSVANAASGLAYQGCATGTTNYSMSFRRTNFACGYYQIDIPYQDDYLTLLIDGVQVFQRNAFTSTLQSNVWTGFLGPTSTVEFQLINLGGSGALQVSFVASSSRPQSLNTDIVICAGTGAALSATSAIAGATYSWSASPSATISFTPAATGSSPTIQTTGATPGGNYTVTNTLTDAAKTGCSTSKTFTMTVDPLPNTTVAPTSGTVSCPTSGITLTASGAASYIWSPAAGLSATTGFSVVATPNVTTTYTVQGSNNCATNSATSTITVIPLASVSTFPTGTWNVYGFNSTTIGTSYQGYYTENGSGVTGLSFDTRTRWTSGAAPSTANTTNGAAWLGCTMNATNISLSFKRTGFTCGVYQLDVPAHDDDFFLFINGVQVAQHVGCCDAHTNVWTGSLNANSTVEWQMKQITAGSFLQVAFSLVAQTAGTSVWLGGTSNDWFTASNWCNGVPTSATDVLILAAGPQNMPVIAGSGAVARNVTISPAIAAGTYNNAIAASTLTTNAFNLDVYGNWNNGGTFAANTGTVSFVGTNSGNTVATTNPQTFNNLVINKNNGITFSSGTNQVRGDMNFTNGIVTQNATLQVLNGGTVSGASNSSFVNGSMTKVGTNAFTFPIGKGALYRPIAISAPAVATDAYTAQYFNTTPNGAYPNAQRAVTLDHVSNAEYWMLSRTAGTSNVNVTLRWASNSGGVGNLSSLRVAAWNGSLWTDEGSGGTTGTTTAGTVVNAAPSIVYGPFTFGTTDNGNALPVELASFDCGLNAEGIVELKWTTASERESDYFDVERTVDAKSFDAIGRVEASGNSNVKVKYTYLDLTAHGGMFYYRLKQVDFDRKATYHSLCAVKASRKKDDFSLFPNPAYGSTSIDLNGSICNSLAVVNSLGQKIDVVYAVVNGQVNISTSTLARGVYVIDLFIDNRAIKLKLVVDE